jgi:hypothetical protein
LTIPFTSSDIWLLVSIGAAESESPVTLADILLTGDTINKAVFTPQELRRGFGKLTLAGYITEAAGTFALTESGRSLVNAARQRSPSWLEVWGELERRLASTRGVEDAPGYEDRRFPYPGMTDEIVAKADREYRQKFEQILADLTERENRRPPN